MTHAIVTVMVEAERCTSDEAIAQRIDELMQPHNENTSVEPYQQDCWCRNRHVVEGEPSPSCVDCRGTGVETTTYNPESKWDWYTLMGPQELRTVPDPTYSILSPEGGWQAHGQLGWWGMSRDEDEDWPTTFARVYDINTKAGAKAFLVDYHI